jgi:hypothetical protein
MACRPWSADHVNNKWYGDCRSLRKHTRAEVHARLSLRQRWGRLWTRPRAWPMNRRSRSVMRVRVGTAWQTPRVRAQAQCSSLTRQRSSRTSIHRYALALEAAIACHSVLQVTPFHEVAVVQSCHSKINHRQVVAQTRSTRTRHVRMSCS